MVKTRIHNLADDIDFNLIAISSHLSDYKISWLFNESLNTKFQQSEDLIVSSTKENTISKFSLFKYENDENSLFTLYSNRSGNDILLKSKKNIDYILKYQGAMSENQIEQLIEKIKKLKNILTVFSIDLQELKLKEIELFK